MSLLVLTDIHMSAGRPAGRIGDYTADVDAKLHEVTSLAHDMNVDAVLCAGDIFHRPAPSLSAFARFLTFLEWLDKRFITIPGSHDLVGNNLDVLYRTAIGLLDRLGLIELLTPVTKDVTRAGSFVVGSPYVDVPDIKLVHESIVPEPVFGEHTLLQDYRARSKIVVVGHEHSGYNLKTVDGTTYVCPGSLVRTIARESELTRRPRVAIIHEDYSVDWHELQSAKPGQDVLVPPVVTPEVDFAGVVQEWASVKIEEIDVTALLKEVAVKEKVSDQVVEYALGMLESE